MKLPAEILASRAVHQYRLRDTLTYVGLRQHLRNRTARRELWSEQIATELVRGRAQGAYHHVLSFKEVRKDGVVDFRTLSIPGPLEALAESALLGECADRGGPFLTPDSVFSYRLCCGEQVDGIFQPYFRGFTERHQAIAAACSRQGKGAVVYADIRKFYPSISASIASDTWHRACDEAKLSVGGRELGEKLLQDYRVANITGILTGPMFSHLLGNLVFREIDAEMIAIAPHGYFRYVDDIALIGSAGEVAEWRARLGARLETLGLSFNSGKDLETSCTEWLQGRDDFADQPGPSWKTFIGGMKQLLLSRPDCRRELTDRFRAAGIRLRPLDYAEAAQERPYLNRMMDYLPWVRARLRTPQEIAEEGRLLAQQYATDLRRWLTRFESRERFERKRALHRLRFLTSRLIYLSPPGDLKEWEDGIAAIPEMVVASTIFRCLHTGDVTPLLRYGASAAQGASQALRGLDHPLFCEPLEWSEEIVQAYAVLRVNGVQLTGSSVSPPDCPLVRFSEWNEVDSLWHCSDPYFRELACVHGPDQPDLHQWAVQTAFDRDDDLVLDIQEFMQDSY